MNLVKSILSDYKIHNADITLRWDATSDDLIDVTEAYRINEIVQISIEKLNCLQ